MSVFKDFPGLENLEKNYSRTFKDPQEPWERCNVDMRPTSILRMSMDRTVVKKNICRKKSEPRPSTANRQNS